MRESSTMRLSLNSSQRFVDQFGQVPCIDCPDPGSRKGPVPSSQDERQHAKVRSDLPLYIHRPGRTQAQGKNIEIPCQQVLHCLPNRLFLWCVPNLETVAKH